MVDLEHEERGALIDIRTVQTVRRVALGLIGAVGFAVLLFTDSTWDAAGTTAIGRGIAYAGLFLIVIAIVGRTWCSFYIGGRKKRLIVETGPYSICRNPLYVFSIMGGAGAGAQFGMLTTALVACAVTILVFTIVTGKEERFLRDKFGASYEAYCARVPRFIPNPWLWRPVRTLEIQPSLVTRTFFDACLLVIAWPAAATIGILQDKAYLPSFWYLP